MLLRFLKRKSREKDGEATVGGYIGLDGINSHFMPSLPLHFRAWVQSSRLLGWCIPIGTSPE